MSKTYMRKEKGGPIVQVPLVKWAGYRKSGYVFVEADEDGNTPAQQFVKQQIDAAPAPAKDDAAGDDGDGLPGEKSNKAEIKAYLDSQGIEYDANAKKAELLELVV